MSVAPYPDARSRHCFNMHSEGAWCTYETYGFCVTCGHRPEMFVLDETRILKSRGHERVAPRSALAQAIACGSKFGDPGPEAVKEFEGLIARFNRGKAA